MLCEKYMEGRSGNRCGLSHKNRIHTTPSAVGYHEFTESTMAMESVPKVGDLVEVPGFQAWGRVSRVYPDGNIDVHYEIRVEAKHAKVVKHG